ncbi:hypothetical protein C3486_00400 [Streptomyces sp. Ru73]|uniref:hypothetical protein n=1 Tax=Streptomyces sp. Ru73 TaxID=2080748 RepID=UPI000CDCE815|nr:hypothetical protein [Streptomyces sp. Ru73]POX43427.1 hypothetical protein C3486_00400 [Streptomyces sp. Ru73]
MADIEETLRDIVRIDGVLGASIVDYFSRLTLGAVGTAGPDLEKAALGDTDVVRAKLFTLELLGYRQDRIEDILITLDSEYHLIRPLVRRRRYEGVFLYVVLDRARMDPVAARDWMRAAEDRLEL